MTTTAIALGHGTATNRAIRTETRNGCAHTHQGPGPRVPSGADGGGGDAAAPVRPRARECSSASATFRRKRYLLARYDLKQQKCVLRYRTKSGRYAPTHEHLELIGTIMAQTEEETRHQPITEEAAKTEICHGDIACGVQLMREDQ